MSMVSVGDRAQQFTSLRNGASIKSELDTLTNRLSSGRVADVTSHLNGETARFSGITYSLTQLDAFGQVASETQQYLSNVQIVLSQVDNTRSATAENLLRVNDTSTRAQIDEAALSARSGFDSIVRALNTQVGDRALMGGTDVAGAPLAPAAVMLAEIETAIGGALDLATITTAIDSWFDDPAGGFALTGYLGDTGQAPQKRVSETRTFEMNARADDPAIKDVLKGAAMAALANDLPGLDRETKSDLLQQAGTRLFSAASDLVALQARVGSTQAGVTQSLAETTAQVTALRIAQNELISADPFETASRLQAVQLQLEMHFSITARMSQLSLLRYL